MRVARCCRPETILSPEFGKRQQAILRNAASGETLMIGDTTAPTPEDQTPVTAQQLAGEDLRAQGILRKFRVKALCTTDDPTDDLAWHRQIAA